MEFPNFEEFGHAPYGQRDFTQEDSTHDDHLVVQTEKFRLLTVTAVTGKQVNA